MQQHTIIRNALFKELLPNSIAIIPSGKIQYRSKDVEYPFRQDSDFYYLTGYPENNALAVFIKEEQESNDADVNGNIKLNANNKNKFILFNQRNNLKHQIWHGKLIGQEQAVLHYGADYAYPIEKIDEILPKLLLGKKIVYYSGFTLSLNNLNLHNLDLDYLDRWQLIVFNFFKKHSKVKAFSENQFKQNKDLLSIIHKLRVIKFPIELDKIRYVTKISADAHNHVMRYVANSKNLTEKHVHAEFYKYCLQNGCDDMAYSPIIAAGDNACILHYTKNVSKLQEDELLLIDAGAEYSNYAADITRTFPVSGKFSAHQKEIYNLVLFAQKQAIEQIRPGQLFNNIQRTVVSIIVQGLIDLKILSGNLADLIHQQAYKQFYMHGSSHFLGLDVHDVGNYTINQHPIPLRQGMVLTVEPGLYFPFDAQNRLNMKWQGIGIRIEDDILITEKGFEILTSNAIKEIDEIEHLMLN